VGKPDPKRFSIVSVDGQDFNNCEVRVFTFVSANDDEAELVEVLEN
jgi:hypothetical protein